MSEKEYDLFYENDDWLEEDGDCLFFNASVGEPPQITSPISSDWDEKYYTHFMILPKAFHLIEDFEETMVESGFSND